MYRQKREWEYEKKIIYIKKREVNVLRQLLFHGAQNRTRTCTPLGTRT